MSSCKGKASSVCHPLLSLSLSLSHTHSHLASGEEEDVFCEPRTQGLPQSFLLLLLTSPLRLCFQSSLVYLQGIMPPQPFSLSPSPSLFLSLFFTVLSLSLALRVSPSPSYAGARAPRGGVTRQGVVLTDLQSLLGCLKLLSHTLSLSLSPSHFPRNTRGTAQTTPAP